jgi:hypothetical protein
VTLADRIEAVLLARGPLPAGELRVEVGKRRDDVFAALHSDQRFVNTGSMRGRGSRWDVRQVSHAVGHLPTFTLDEIAARWQRTLKLDHYTAATFVDWFVEIGYLESLDGNGRVRVTERGRHVSHVLNRATP